MVVNLQMEEEGCFYKQPFEQTDDINLLERFQDQRWNRRWRIDVPRICYSWKGYDSYDVDGYDARRL